jgi:ABC-type branched-subunit amino acid transport system substrate-binding protein
VYGIRQNTIVLSVLLLVAAATQLTAQTPLALRVGLVTQVKPSPTAGSVSRGVELGAAEAKQTATLFGGDVLLFEEKAGANAESAAAKLLGQRKVQVLIGSSADDADALSRFAEKHGLIFFNTSSRATALRAACRRYTFHVEASDSMYANASRRGGSSAPSTGSTLLWSGSLEKYGASQINDRFRSRYHSAMDGSAWAGWVAVKLAAEAALRARSARPTALLAYLESPSTSFDGHKGWPLSFRSADHQLRQPLYVVVSSAKPGEPIRDVPALSALAAGGTNANQLLDAVMPRSTTRCAWKRS